MLSDIHWEAAAETLSPYKSIAQTACWQEKVDTASGARQDNVRQFDPVVYREHDFEDGDSHDKHKLSFRAS